MNMVTAAIISNPVIQIERIHCPVGVICLVHMKQEQQCVLVAVV